MKLWKWKAVGLLLSISLGGLLAQAAEPPQTPPEDKPAAQAPSNPAHASAGEKRIWYRLVNVSIPPESKHRRDKGIDWPPQIYVILEKDGTQVGDASTTKTGWSADYPDTEQNCWPIRESKDIRYSLQVWDYNPIQRDQLILSITDLSGEDFREEIYEQGGELEDKSRLVRIQFKATQPPKESP